MELDVIPILSQFGVAGLVAWMWLVERRAAATREQQLSAAHERVMAQRVELESLVQVVRDNSQAMAALEASQREMISAVRMGWGARVWAGAGGVAGGVPGGERSVHSHDDAA